MVITSAWTMLTRPNQLHVYYQKDMPPRNHHCVSQLWTTLLNAASVRLRVTQDQDDWHHDHTKGNGLGNAKKGCQCEKATRVISNHRVCPQAEIKCITKG